MTHAMRVLIQRYTDPAYNVYCELSVTLRHGLGPAQPGDEEILAQLRDLDAPEWMQCRPDEVWVRATADHHDEPAA